MEEESRRMKVFTPEPDLYAAAGAGTVFFRMDRGILLGRGADRLDLLHRLSTNATRELAPGDETTTVLTSDKGRVIDLLRIIAFDDHILMIAHGSDAGRIRTWLDKYTVMDDFSSEDLGGSHAVLGVYGEHARLLLGQMLGIAMPDSGKAAVKSTDRGDVVVVRDTRLAEGGGFLIAGPREEIEEFEEKLMDHGVVALDEATYETLRIEAGQPSIGRELGDAYNPLEAGLVQFISFTKGCYIGQEVIARLDTYDKVQRHLVGFLLEHDPGEIQPAGLTVFGSDQGTKIGTVTSIARSPSVGRTIALGYVRTQQAIPGAEVSLVPDGEADAQPIAATIARLPFDR